MLSTGSEGNTLFYGYIRSGETDPKSNVVVYAVTDSVILQKQ